MLTKSALALSYSATEFANSEWLQSSTRQAGRRGSQQSITGCFKAKLIHNLYSLAGVMQEVVTKTEKHKMDPISFFVRA